MKHTSIAILSLLLAAPWAGAQGIITTVAGTGAPGFSGDGGPATSAKLNYPQGMAVDSAGNLYVADNNNMRVRRITPAGVITTVAGNGIGDFTGENGRATNESLWFPMDVAADSAGNLYIVDSHNNRIRKVSPSGSMTTVAGGGECCGLRDGGPATRATLSLPTGVAVDTNGNIYIADSDHYRIRKVSLHGEITTVAGTGGFLTSGDGGPARNASIGAVLHVALDPAANLYIASYERVLKVSPSGTITVVAGGAIDYGPIEGVPATSVRLSIYSVAVDGGGNLLIGTYDRVLRVNPSGIITTIAGGGSNPGDGIPSDQANLRGVSGIALDAAGNIYLTETNANRVRKITR